MRTILPSEMKALETRFMQRRGIPSLLLMERAAAGVVEAVARRAVPGLPVLFLCGCGNNGGDGFAAARLWQGLGGVSLVWRLPGKLSPDAEINERLAEEARVEITTVEDLPPRLPLCGLIVDALFGTGLSRPPEGLAAQLIELANAGGVTVSYFEQCQNAQNYYWSLEEVQQRLDQKMTRAFKAVYEMSQEKKINLRDAAYLVAVKRVADAAKLRGWC